jgi:hypothetical protein
VTNDWRVLSLTQPFATAIALELKHWETRSWGTKYRGRLAIHAAKGFPLVYKALAAVEHSLGRLPARLPLAGIICVSEVTDCRRTEEVMAEGLIGSIEKLYGDYTPGRYAWHTENVIAFPEQCFIGCRGKLGLWRPSDEIARAIEAAVEGVRAEKERRAS